MSGKRACLLAAVAVGGVFLMGASCEGDFQTLRERLSDSIRPKPAAAPPKPEATPEPPFRLEAVAEEVQITTDPSPELWPRIAPGGTTLVFTSQKTGNFEVYYLDLANPRLQFQLSTRGGNKCRTTQTPDALTVIFDRYHGFPPKYSLLRMSWAERHEGVLLDRAIHVITPDLSPNGERLAFGLVEMGPAVDAAQLCVPPLHEAAAPGLPSLWFSSADGSHPIHVGRGFYPRWSADGRKVAFVSLATGNADIWTVNADGSELTQITFDRSHEIDAAWSPDGTRLVFASDRRTRGNFDLWMIDLRDGRIVQLTGDSGHDGGPTWAPDGRHIYFHSHRNGNWDLYRVAPILQ